jgi:hypothetical protein
LRLEIGRSPRFADKAAPAAICCFFDFAGMAFTPWFWKQERAPVRAVPDFYGRLRLRLPRPVAISLRDQPINLNPKPRLRPVEVAFGEERA